MLPATDLLVIPFQLLCFPKGIAQAVCGLCSRLRAFSVPPQWKILGKCHESEVQLIKVDGWKVSRNKCVFKCMLGIEAKSRWRGELCQGGGMEDNQFVQGGGKRREKVQPLAWDGQRGQAETAGTAELCQHSPISQID